jgi:GNAT superfamily N-acetyltransferase
LRLAVRPVRPVSEPERRDPARLPRGVLALVARLLAVDPAHRRRGVARALLARAEEAAAAHDLEGVALDTGLQNEPARALYVASGYREREIRRAPNAATAAAIGGPGFVSYLKRL